MRTPVYWSSTNSDEHAQVRPLIKWRRPYSLFSTLAFTLLSVAGQSFQTAAGADVEAFELQNVRSGRPNVLFVLDSTSTMRATSSLPGFDPGKPYPSDYRDGCDPAYAYFSPADVKPASCKLGKNVGRVAISALRCDSTTLDRLRDIGATEAADTPAVERLRYLEAGAGRRGTTYEPLAPSPVAGNLVYCSKYEGSGAPPEANFSTAQPMTLWSGNYLNYEVWAKQQPVEEGDDKMEQVRIALKAVATKYKDDINMGLMRTSTNGQPDPDGTGEGAASGGPVIFDVSPGSGRAIFSAYHGGLTRLEDFIWTLYDRVACKGSADCGGIPANMPKVEDCKPNDPDADCVQVMTPNGGKKPLAETMYEAALYFRGDPPDFGSNSFIDPTIRFDSVPQSLHQCPNDNKQCYLSPLEANKEDCQRNYIILLTDGTSEGDGGRDIEITNLLEGLPSTTAVNEALTKRYGKTSGFNKADCELGGVWSTSSKNPSNCIDDAAFYLRTDPTLNVETFAVGFQLALSGKEQEARAMLDQIAEAGGTTKMVSTDDPKGLNILLDAVVSQILTANTSFSAPSVTINAFNRTQNLNDLYMAVFATERKRKWEGNVKKYTIRPTDGKIIDFAEQVAVDDASGFFKGTSTSLWLKGVADGALAPFGGAASLIPGPEADPTLGRQIYVDTYSSPNPDLQLLGEFVADLSPEDAQDVFGLGAFDLADVPTEVTTLVNWFYGIDTYDEYPPRVDKEGRRIDGNGNKTEDKRLMGDPLHSRPAVVVYGKDGDKEDAVVFITTNEGLLHAIDAKTGVEQWAFAPQELLDRLDFLRNFTAETDLKDRRSPLYYGLDGTVRILRIDRDRDGPIDATKGDRVFAYFGMRRGGSSYYALDVTDRSSPKLMWRFELPDGAQSWSNPVVGETIRSNVKGATYGTFGTFKNSEANNRFIVMIGGGFDPSNDVMTFARDTTGNKIYMLDAASGDILWSAGPSETGSTASLKLDRMRHSITGDIRALDLSGDGFIDRMYAADLGGQVWRFDVFDGQPAKPATLGDTGLVQGGVMASVGGEEDPTVDRRFYYAPDVSEAKCGGRVFYNVAIGSGDRENPVSDTISPNKPVENAFYSFRDYLLRTAVDSDNYKASCPIPAPGEALPPCFETIVDGAGSTLVDVTEEANPAVDGTNSGWKLRLTHSDRDEGVLFGEKSLAESRTFAGRVFFTTYAPHKSDNPAQQCGDQVGVNRLYVVNACNARPFPLYYDATVPELGIDDRSEVLDQGSIAPEVVFVFPSPLDPDCTGKDCRPDPVCLVGLEGCGTSPGNRPVRTFWRERGAE